jgi:hypothetical protein
LSAGAAAVGFLLIALPAGVIGAHVPTGATSPCVTAAVAADSDATSPARLVCAFYAANSANDWARLRRLFAPGAQLVIAGRRRAETRSVDAWLAERQRSGTRVRETQLGHRSEEYGTIAHVWSAYELEIASMDGAAGRTDDSVARAAPTVLRGVNSFQCVRIEGQWRIAHLLWTDTRFAEPLPADLVDTARARVP